MTAVPAVLAAPHIAACKLTKGQVKRLPLVSIRPLMFVVSCPCCGWKAQVMANEYRLGENPLQLEPAIRCGGCRATYLIRDGAFEIGESDGR